MPYDPNRVDYSPAQQAAITIHLEDRGYFDRMLPRGDHLADPALAVLVPDLAELDPTDATAVEAHRAAAQDAINAAMTAKELLNHDVVRMYNTANAMATALAEA